MAKDIEQVKKDKKIEEIAHDFLEKHFYNLTKEYQFHLDKETQLKGIDTTFTIGNFGYKCDEKSTLSGFLRTQCLELSSLNKYDKLTEGWITDDSLENNSYLFLWINKRVKSELTDANEILDADIVLVRKDEILNYLARCGWTKEKLREKAYKIRYENDTDFGDFETNGCKFSFSNQLNEDKTRKQKEFSINVLLTKETYKSLPYTIYRKIKTYNNNEK